jgi:carbohydrate-selective porin OprB
MRILTLLAVLLILSRSAAAQVNMASGPPSTGEGSPHTGDFDGNQLNRAWLFGDWDGTRLGLAERGVTFDFGYSTDQLAPVTGEKRNDYEVWNRFRGTVDVDFSRFTGWHGLTFHATGVWQSGSNIGTLLGTIANPSGMASEHTARMDSFWFQQALFADRLFLKVGQFAGQDFYGVQRYGESFLGEPVSYAPGNLFSTVYESADPQSTPAGEIAAVPNPHVYVKAAITSANRNPFVQDPDGLHFAIRNNGAGVFEAGFLPHPPNSRGDATRKTYPGLYRFGAVYNPGPFTNPVTRVTSHGNYMLYGMANQVVYRKCAGSDEGLDVFFTTNYSPSGVSEVNTETTLGVRYKGLFPHRGMDSLGISLIYSKISDTFNLAFVNEGLPVLGSEKVTEINYLFRITRWWYIQPAYQHYWSIGANPGIGSASILGFRSKITF